MAGLTHHLRRAGVCVASGYGIKIQVRRGQLLVEDGLGRKRRSRVYSRASHGISRTRTRGSGSLHTPLTGTHRSARYERGRRRTPAPATKPPRPAASCKRCGAPVPRRIRTYGDDCFAHYQREQYEKAFHGSGLAAIERTKANGDDPTHGATAAGRRAEANITRKRQARDWDEQHGKLVDLSGFERDILPLIQDVSLSRLQKVTGLSLRYVSLIRRGDRTPHPRHWQTLIEATDGRAQFIGDAEALAKRDS